MTVGATLKRVILGERGMSEDREERFAAYVDALAEVIGHADRAAPLRDYWPGLAAAGRAQERGADRGGNGAGPGLGPAPVVAAFRRQRAVVERTGSRPDTGADPTGC